MRALHRSGAGLLMVVLIMTPASTRLPTPQPAGVEPAAAEHDTSPVSATITLDSPEHGGEWTPRPVISEETLTSSVAHHPLADAAPDVTAHYDGASGWALRLYDIDGHVDLGHIYSLAGRSNVTTGGGLQAWIDTPRIPTHPRSSVTALQGHLDAHRLASDLLDVELPLVDVTTAGGDGPSAGLAQWVAYMDLGTAGEFTGGIPTAATGALLDSGHLTTVTSTTSKVEAAALTPAAAVFTTGYNGDRPVAVRRSFSQQRDVSADDRRWAEIMAAAAEHDITNVDGLVVVVVGHVGDVAAWFCGTGSQAACDTMNRFGTVDG